MVPVIWLAQIGAIYSQIAPFFALNHIKCPVFGRFQNGFNKVVIELNGVQFWSEIILVISNRTRAARSFDFEITRMISDLIMYMKKLLDSDWLRTVQFFLNTVQKRGNWVQKKVIKQAFWLVNEQRSSQIANQIFCFQIKRAPWMAQFFLDCVSSESVKFKTSFTQIFSCILLKCL